MAGYDKVNPYVRGGYVFSQQPLQGVYPFAVLLVAIMVMLCCLLLAGVVCLGGYAGGLFLGRYAQRNKIAEDEEMEEESERAVLHV